VFLEGRRLIWLLGTVVGSAAVLLTHPITAVAMAVGAAALVVTKGNVSRWTV
jgi:hypothetical protein